jgi:hypothetical protein
MIAVGTPSSLMGVCEEFAQLIDILDKYLHARFHGILRLTIHRCATRQLPSKVQHLYCPPHNKCQARMAR